MTPEVTTPNAAVRPPPGELLAWVVVALLTVYLVFIGGGWQGIYSSELRTLSLELIAGGLAVWLVVAIFRPDWRPKSVLWPALLAGLVAMAISLALSPTPRLGADYLAYAVLLAALYLLLQRLMAHGASRARFTRLTVVLFFGVALAYIAVVVRDWINWWGLIGRFATPPLRPYFEGLLYGNPSAVMTIAVLLLTPALAYVGFDTRRSRLTAGAMIVLALVVTLMSGSRAGWLAIVVAVGITAIAWLSSAANRQTIARLATPRVRVVAGVVIAVGAVAAILFGPAILLRFAGGGEDLRSGLYVASLRMFEDAPFAGSGPGTWVVQRPAFTLPTEIDYYIPHAHDIYVQALAEFGLLAVAAGAVVAVFLFWLIRDGIRDPDPMRSRFGWAALFATTYFAAHQVLDFYPNMPAAIFAWAIPIALLDATATRSILRTSSGRLAVWWRRLRPVAAIAGVVVVVGAVGWLVRSESAARTMSSGVELANENDWAGALPFFRAAVAADPDMPPYQLALGLALANTGDQAGGLAAIEQEATADNLPTGWLDVASLRAGLGDSAGARDALERALRLGVQEAGVNLGAGTVWLQLGDEEQAKHYLTLAVTMRPSIAGDPWWNSGPAAAIAPEVIATALATSPPATAFDIALSSGDVDRASAIADQLTGDDAELLRELVLPAWSGDPEAVAALYARAAQRPYDQATLAWAQRVASHTGDEERARDFRTWADTVNPGSGASGTEMGIAPDVTSGNGAGSWGFYGHYTYRRPTPWDQIVAGLPHLVFR